jgi:hypothetical protein
MASHGRKCGMSTNIRTGMAALTRLATDERFVLRLDRDF